MLKTQPPECGTICFDRFLIAAALLIICHSLFEVVIEQVADRCQLVFTFGGIDVVPNCYQTDIMFGENPSVNLPVS